MARNFPFGDAFLVGTPSLDKLGDRLYAHQQQQEMMQQKELQSIDDEFKKNVTNIRTADIPDFTKLYNDYRISRIGLLKSDPNKRDDYIKKQQEVNEKLANAYSLLNDSATRKNWEKEMGSRLKVKPLDFVDNAGTMLQTSMGVPVRQLPNFKVQDQQGNETTLDSEEPFIYKKGFNFTKDISSAFGAAPRDLGSFDETKDPKSLQKAYGKYKGYNDPFTAYSYLVNSLASDPRKAQSFIREHQFDPLTEQRIANRFGDLMNDPNFKKVYHLTGDEDFTGADTDLGKAAMLTVMLGTRQPSRTEELRTDEQNKMDYAQKQAITRIKLSSALAEGRSEALHDLAKQDKKEASLWIDDYVNGLPDKGEEFQYKEAGGGWQQAKKVPLSPVIEKALTIDGKVTADFLFHTPDGNYRYGLYKRDKDNNLIKEGKTYAIDPEKTKSISPEDLKMAIGKQAGVTQMNKEMSGSGKSNYIIKGKSYSEKELLDMGYSIDQIKPYKK